MIQINLQWFALPFLLIGCYLFTRGIFVWIASRKQVDILPLIGAAIAVRAICQAIVSFFVSYLIWRAFR